jgi:hypothetical protein
MAKFHVKNFFEIPDRQLFVMAGSVTEGEIVAGMYAQIQVSPMMDMAARIHSIEFARREGGEDVCLCFQSKPRTLQVWRGLSVSDKTLEVTTDVGD